MKFSCLAQTDIYEKTKVGKTFIVLQMYELFSNTPNISPIFCQIAPYLPTVAFPLTTLSIPDITKTKECRYNSTLYIV